MFGFLIIAAINLMVFFGLSSYQNYTWTVLCLSLGRELFLSTVANILLRVRDCDELKICHNLLAFL